MYTKDELNPQPSIHATGGLDTCCIQVSISLNLPCIDTSLIPVWSRPTEAFQGFFARLLWTIDQWCIEILKTVTVVWSTAAINRHRRIPISAMWVRRAGIWANSATTIVSWWWSSCRRMWRDTIQTTCWGCFIAVAWCHGVTVFVLGFLDALTWPSMFVIPGFVVWFH